MKVYSDTLTASDLQAAVPEGTYLRAFPLGRTRVRSHGWEVRLCSTTSRRHFNSGQHGAATWEDDHPASWDQYGAWIAGLFSIDPEARIAFYDGADDFHKQTDGRYMLPSEASR